MDKFKQHEFTIENERGVTTAVGEPEVRVVKFETESAPDVKNFELPKLQRAGQGSYAATRAKYGALAATDDDRAPRIQKDSRFSLNPLLRGPLSVESEERRVIEERVRERVVAVAEESQKRAAEIGYHEGYQKGYDEAFLKFRTEAAERMAQFDHFLEACEAAKREIYCANERFLVELVYRIGRMVLLTELATDKEYISRLARELIEKIGIRENITLYVNPAEMETATLIEESLVKSIGGLKNLKVEASPDVLRGGCAIETEWNAIDASIETQLQAIYGALIQGAGGIPGTGKTDGNAAE